MTDSTKITLFTKQLVHNPLLCRKQMGIEIIHTNSMNVSKTQIREKLASMFKVDVSVIAVYGMKFKFGGGRSTGFALVYDSVDARKANDQKCFLRRDDLVQKTKKVGRKQGKEIKSRAKRLRGVAKSKVASGKKK